MQGRQVFEYAVIRLVPRVEREEFINVGVILFSKQLKFLDLRYALPAEKLQALCPDLDPQEAEAQLQAFARICRGGREGGPIGQLDLPSRFRWLTAMRSTRLQCSPVHPGFCEDPVQALDRLFEQLVK
jgi:hypothetical protein